MSIVVSIWGDHTSHLQGCTPHARKIVKDDFPEGEIIGFASGLRKLHISKSREEHWNIIWKKKLEETIVKWRSPNSTALFGEKKSHLDFGFHVSGPRGLGLCLPQMARAGGDPGTRGPRCSRGASGKHRRCKTMENHHEKHGVNQ